MKKLFVTGCSFSYKGENTSWGRILADMLNYDYVPAEANGGSNYRMWRVVTTAIMKQELTPNDLLCIQYSSNDRKEFWSQTKHIYDPYQKRQDFFGTGSILRFKEGSSMHHHVFTTKIEANFLQLYNNHFCDPEFNDHMFAVNHLMFQCMLKHFQIPTIFFFTRYKDIADTVMLDPFKAWAYSESEEFVSDPKYWRSFDDSYHMNDLGHYQTAEQLQTHIKNIYLSFDPL